jgi:hypothetical protein
LQGMASWGRASEASKETGSSINVFRASRPLSTGKLRFLFKAVTLILPSQTHHHRSSSSLIGLRQTPIANLYKSVLINHVHNSPRIVSTVDRHPLAQKMNIQDTTNELYPPPPPKKKGGGRGQIRFLFLFLFLALLFFIFNFTFQAPQPVISDYKCD